MGAIELDDLPDQALLLVDSAPIIFYIEDHPTFADRFAPVFEAQEAGRVRIAVSTAAIAEVLVGPFKSNDEALVRRYRTILESWQVVGLDIKTAESAAQFRASLGLKLIDAIQVASAVSIGAAAIVTHDRDFSRVRSLRVIS
jgi:predicted nucleic acid-binding protein